MASFGLKIRLPTEANLLRPGDGAGGAEGKIVSSLTTAADSMT
jgi:hypothetical protein